MKKQSILPALFILLFAVSFGAFHAGAQSFWTPVNEGIEWEFPSRLLSAPDGTIYLSGQGGIYFSSDFGSSWTFAPIGGNSTIRTFALTGNGTLLAATYDSIFRSTDYGYNWQSSGCTVHVATIAVDGNTLYGARGSGLYRSDDDGRTWQKLHDSISGQFVYINGLIAMPVGQLFALMSNGTFIHSSDGGVTWEKIGANVCETDDRRVNLFRASSGTFFIGGYSGICRSSDGGKSWQLIDTARLASLAQGEDRALYFATEAGIRRSVDDGSTWESLGRVPLYDVMVASDGTFIGCNRTGVLRSIDVMKWETSNNGLHGIFTSAMAVAPNGSVLAGIERDRSQIVRTADDGRIWEVLHDSLPRSVSALYTTPSGMLLAAIDAGWEENGMVYASNDDGRTWELIVDDLDGSIVEFMAARNGILYAAMRRAGGFGTLGGTIYRSLDEGWTWEKTPFDHAATAIREGKGGAIFASTFYWSDMLGSEGGEIYRSTDDGLSWSAVSPNIRSSDHRRINYYGIDLTIDREGHIYTCGGNAIYRSADNGSSWSRFDVFEEDMETTNIGRMHIGRLAIDSVGNLYAVRYWEGIFRSTDNGEHWAPWNDGMTPSSVTALATSSRGVLFAGTNHNGIYRSPRPLLGEIPAPQAPSFIALALGEPTPNPSLDGGTIGFSIPEAGHVTLSITNTLGQHLGTLLDGWRPAGAYTVRINTSGLADGVYVVTLDALGARESRQLVVTKRGGE